MNCCCVDGKSAGLAVGRWSLGLILVIGGLGKIMGGTGDIAPLLARTSLPAVAVALATHALPWLKLLLGAGLLIGICRNCALVATALLYLSIAIGNRLIQQYSAASDCFIYISLAVILLIFGDNDTWRWRRKAEIKPAASGCCCASDGDSGSSDCCSSDESDDTSPGCCCR